MSVDDTLNEGEIQAGGGFTGLIRRMHNAVFGSIERAFEGWFIGLAARFVFTSVLLVYFINSGILKLGDGFFGFLSPSVGAFAQILPSVMEQAGFDISAIPFFPWHLIVLAGTWAELLLPVMLVVGLFTRIAALGMAIFIIVQSYVDIVFHGLEPEFVGAMFDPAQDAIIYDQRLLWLFPLLVLIVKGGGKLSLDYLMSRGR